MCFECLQHVFLSFYFLTSLKARSVCRFIDTGVLSIESCRILLKTEEHPELTKKLKET